MPELCEFTLIHADHKVVVNSQSCPESLRSARPCGWEWCTINNELHTTSGRRAERGARSAERAAREAHAAGRKELAGWPAARKKELAFYLIKKDGKESSASKKVLC